MRWLFVFLASCGRIDFDPLRDAAKSIDSGGPDATIPDRVLFLPFNNTFDDNGNHRTGVCDPKCPTFGPGHDANGAVFDGTECLRYDDIAAYNTQSFTLAVWVDMNAYAGGTFIAKTFGTGALDSYQLWTDADNAATLATNINDAGNDQLETPRTNAAWTFVAGTYDGTTKRVYINGVEKVNTPYSGLIRFDSGSIWLGCDHDAGVPSAQITGTIDDVFIYTRALSAAELATLATM